MEKIPPSGNWTGAFVAFVVGCAISLALASSASALTFAPPISVGAGNNPHSVVSADFNGDGFPDIVTANIFGDNVSITLGDGAGGFSGPAFFPVGNNPEAITTGDFNGDGFPDIASANISADSISVLLGDGSGGFAGPMGFGVGDGPHYIATADFDGDGYLDLVTTDFYGNDITVVPGNGDGTFGPGVQHPIGSGQGPVSVTTADFNGDGFRDIATANYTSGDLSVLFGNGDGTFGPATVIPVPPNPQGIGAGDFNGDGFTDLASANQSSDSFAVMLGDGAGNFGPPSLFGTGPGTGPNFVLVIDFDGDGNLDLTSANYNTDNISVLSGDGAGNFGPPRHFSTGGATYPVSLTSADFNGDGLPDIASANFLPSHISVLLNLPEKADVEITKTAAPSNPNPGDIVTYTLKAKNIGNKAAADVSVTDSLPVGVSFVSADPPCVHSQGTVDCAIGSLAPGDEVTLEVRVKVEGWGSANPGPGHLVDVQRVENQIDLNAGQQRTISVSCPSGFFVVDGSVRIDHIDQGGGDWPAPQVLESRSTSAGTWQGTVRNTATGRVQAKIFSVCTRQQTINEAGHHHGLIITSPITNFQSSPAGEHQATLQCGPGQTAIQPGFISNAPGDLLYSQPAGNGWKFVFDAHSPAEVTFSIRCLTRQVSLAGGHTHDLNLERIGTEVEIPAEKVNEVQLTCADGSKGIVAGWDLDHRLLSLGNDPRPVTRAFKLYNPTAIPLHARLTLLCLGDRTGPERLGPVDLVNTAFISTSSDESELLNNLSSATIAGGGSVVTPPIPDPTPPVKTVGSGIVEEKIESVEDENATILVDSVLVTITCQSACSGNAKLTTTSKVKVKGRKFSKGTLLAKGRFRFTKATVGKVRLKMTARGKKILKSGKARGTGLLSTSTGLRRYLTIHSRN